MRFKFNIREILATYGILVILFVLCIGISFMNNAFYSVGNIINVFRQVSVNGVIACGMTMVIISSGIDLSAGSILALCGVVTASFAGEEGSSVLKAILAGVFVGALCGLVNGSFIAFTKIPPFIATLGMQQAARGISLLYSNGRPIANLSSNFRSFGTGSFGVIPYPVIVCVCVVLVTFFVLKKTKFGRHVYAIGGNEQAAQVCGIQVAKVKLVLYCYIGILVGLAAAIITARVNAGTPSAGVNYEFDAITAVVIGGASLNGGIGTMHGTVIGVFLIGVLNNGLSLMQISPYWQQIIKGALIVSAVLLDTWKNRFMSDYVKA
jgi:inositol transport system permease protein